MTNNQIPSSKQVPMTEIPITKRLGIGAWVLEFIWLLEFGAC